MRPDGTARQCSAQPGVGSGSRRSAYPAGLEGCWPRSVVSPGRARLDSRRQFIGGVGELKARGKMSLHCIAVTAAAAAAAGVRVLRHHLLCFSSSDAQQKRLHRNCIRKTALQFGIIGPKSP